MFFFRGIVFFLVVFGVTGELRFIFFFLSIVVLKYFLVRDGVLKRFLRFFYWRRLGVLNLSLKSVFEIRDVYGFLSRVFYVIYFCLFCVIDSSE